MYPGNEPEGGPNWNDVLVITGALAVVVVTVAAPWVRPDIPVPLV